MIKSVLIAGMGASSMYAILACNDLGIKPVLAVRESTIRVQAGSYWLKWLPANLRQNFNIHKIRIDKIGSRKGYIEKQWPFHPPDYESSFPESCSEEYGYNPHEVLTSIFSEDERYTKISCGNISDYELISLSSRYDLIFHTFPSQLGKRINNKIMAKIPICVSKNSYPGNVTIYDGTDNKHTRISYLFGYRYIEYPFYQDPDPEDGDVIFTQDLCPTDYTPNMGQIQENIIPIGRFGRFERKILSHDAYDLVRGYIDDA